MSKAIILSRVSTQNQDLQQQTDEVLKFADADGYSGDNVEVIEDKESGVKLSEEHRLGLIELKQKILANPGMYSCVYAYEISRIGRRSEVNYSIRNFLQENRVQLVIVKPYIKLFDANFKIDETANMTFALFNALAENEGYLRKERLARGKAKKQNSGGYVGGRIPYGYMVDSEKKIVIDPEESKMIQYIFDEYVNHDRSTYSLGMELMQTGQIRSTTLASAMVAVRQILKHPSYIGGKAEYRSDKNRHAKNVYPRIISDGLFEAAQKKLQINSSAKTEHKHIYFCKGLIKDSRNGRTLAPNASSANYGCSHITLTEKHTISIPVNLIDSFIWHLTKEYNKMSGDAKRRLIIKDTKNSVKLTYKKIANIKKKLAGLEDKERRIQERIVAGKVKESLGDSMLETIYSQQEQLTNLIASLENEAKQQIKRIIRLELTVKTDLTKISSDEEKVKFIKETIEKIELTKYNTDNKKTTEPTGYIIVTYTTGQSELYYYHTYTHEFFDANMQPVGYTYLKRMTSINAKRYQKKQNEKEKP